MAKERTYTEGEMKSAEKLLAQAKQNAAKIKAKADAEIKRLEEENKKYQAKIKKSALGTAHTKNLIQNNEKKIAKLEAQKVAANREVSAKRGYLVRIQKYMIKQDKLGQKDESKPAVQEVKSQVKADAENAEVVKKGMKKSRKVPQPTINKANNPSMPKEVEAQMNRLGAEYKLMTRSDDKGNRVYIFENFDHKSFVMTQLKNQDTPSAIMDASSEQMRALRKQVAEVTGKSEKSDISELIGNINNQANRELKEKEVYEASKKEAREVFANMGKSNFNEKELADFKPDVSTVMLVPHTKKNGKLSKRKHDIQLRDADGNVFTLTKKDMKKALKEQRKNAEGRTDGDKPTWKKYVKAAEEGRLTPEDVAQFFKEEKPNLGADKKMENKSQEVTKTVKAEKPKAPISDVPFKIAVARQTLRGG